MIIMDYPHCDKHFDRGYNLKRHLEVVHSIPDKKPRFSDDEETQSNQSSDSDSNDSVNSENENNELYNINNEELQIYDNVLTNASKYHLKVNKMGLLNLIIDQNQKALEDSGVKNDLEYEIDKSEDFYFNLDQIDFLQRLIHLIKEQEIDFNRRNFFVLSLKFQEPVESSSEDGSNNDEQ